MKKRIFKGLGIAIAAVFAFGVMACSHEDSHEHSFSTEWTTTESTHWHAATCKHTDLKKDQGPHVWDNEDYQYDTVSGKDKRTCTVCGYVDAKKHFHIHDAGDGTIKTAAAISSAGVISYTCTGCNASYDELFCGPLGQDGNAATKSSVYVYFGVFPQTAMASTVTVDENTFIEMGGKTYYKGDDDQYYAKTGESYYKVEPIKWKILTTQYDIDGEAGNEEACLLLAEKILTANVPFYPDESYRSIGGITVYPNNYKYSRIRAYLNGRYENGDTQSADFKNAGLLQAAFTSDEQEQINNTIIDNDSENKLFLLSAGEASNSAYGFPADDYRVDGNVRVRKATDYGRANGAYQSYNPVNGGNWWLRSTGYENGQARSIDYDGWNQVSSGVNIWKIGIVPALTIGLGE